MREAQGSFAVQLQSGDNLTLRYLNDYELIPLPFPIAPGVVVPVGGYDYQSGVVSYLFGQQRKIAGTLSYQDGSLYDGTKRTVGFSGARVVVSSQFQIEPSVSANWVSLPWGAFTSTVVSARTTYMVSPRMFMSVLIQYNSSLDHAEYECPVPLGIPTRQRAVRRLQRRPRHGDEGSSRARQPGIRRQDQSPVPILGLKDLNAERRTQNAERRTQNAERRTQNAERRT